MHSAHLHSSYALRCRCRSKGKWVVMGTPGFAEEASQGLLARSAGVRWDMKAHGLKTPCHKRNAETATCDMGEWEGNAQALSFPAPLAPSVHPLLSPTFLEVANTAAKQVQK
jgi:hypothetical protein